MVSPMKSICLLTIQKFALIWCYEGLHSGMIREERDYKNWVEQMT